MEITKIPLKQWREDMKRIASDWNGEDSSYRSEGKVYTEEQAHIAHETTELIEKLAKNLDELEY